MWNWELKSYNNCTDYCECMCTRYSHTHMHRTCLNHIASQYNSEVWLLTSRQGYWSSLELKGCYVKNWELKCFEMCTMYTCRWLHGKFSECTHAEVTNTMSTVYTTLDYGYRHKNKGTDLILVPRNCWVYKWDQKLQNVYSIDWHEVYTKCSSSHTQKSPMPCLLLTPL